METPQCLNAFQRRLGRSYFVLRLFLISLMGLIGAAALVAPLRFWILPGILMLVLILVTVLHVASRMEATLDLLKDPKLAFWFHPHRDNLKSQEFNKKQKRCWVVHLRDGRNLDLNLMEDDVNTVTKWLTGHSPSICIGDLKQLMY